MYIYKITNNINNKQYIGLYTKRVEESTNYYGSGKLINQAVKKYGKENFTKEILERDITDKSYLNDREIYWIAKFDTFNNGYNLTMGGQGNLGRVTSEETKRKIRETRKGKPLPRATEPCPHCGRTLAQSHMTSYHGHKCKKAPLI
jgi:group I intron endonuclease